MHDADLKAVNLQGEIIMLDHGAHAAALSSSSRYLPY